jgi:hypothetical protein
VLSNAAPGIRKMNYGRDRNLYTHISVNYFHKPGLSVIGSSSCLVFAKGTSYACMWDRKVLLSHPSECARIDMGTAKSPVMEK